MKKKHFFLIYPLLLMGAFLVFANSCKKDDPPNNTYTISGKLFNSTTTEAISNAYITFDDRSYTTSASDGSFETKITEGNRLISVFAENYIVFSGFVDVNANTVFNVALEYKSGAGTSGVVTGSVNSTSTDIITINTAGFFVQTDENGHYSLRLPVGTHEVMAMDDTGVSDAIEVTVTNNGVSSADLTVTDDDRCYRVVSLTHGWTLGSYKVWIKPNGPEITAGCTNNAFFFIHDQTDLDMCIEKVVYEFSDGSPAQTVLANSGRIDYAGEKDGFFVLTSKPVGIVTVTATIHFNDGRTKTKQITQDWGTKYCDNMGGGGENSFTDPRDGNIYQTVTIGSQVWMAENLKYLTSVVGYETFSDAAPYYYVYDYDGTNVTAAKATGNYATYGVLYNWTAAINACPQGWHLPSDDEWDELEGYLGGQSVAGGKLKATTHWNSPNTGATNETGFTALPGGLLYGDGGNDPFDGIGSDGFWWTSTYYMAGDDKDARFRKLSAIYTDMHASGMFGATGMAVRCVKD